MGHVGQVCAICELNFHQHPDFVDICGLGEDGLEDGCDWGLVYKGASLVEAKTVGVLIARCQGKGRAGGPG
eukprot:123632-Pelagomonas_calceolata.AAC.1